MHLKNKQIYFMDELVRVMVHLFHDDLHTGWAAMSFNLLLNLDAHIVLQIRKIEAICNANKLEDIPTGSEK